MKPRVYIETTIPSFYFETRSTPEMVARRQWTRHWWDSAAAAYDLVTSSAVIDELARGAFPSRDKALSLVASLMPRDPLGDALHLALASFNRCDFLLTWNCEHLANANKFGHILRINSLLRVPTPAMVTPLELGGDTDVH